jgi:hypothetical protein
MDSFLPAELSMGLEEPTEADRMSNHAGFNPVGVGGF